MKKSLSKKRISFLCTAILCAGAIFAESNQNENFPPPPHESAKQFDAVVKVDSGTKVLKNEKIESDEDGKNAVFAQNDGKVSATGLTIRTKKNDSRGLYAAFGGTISAKKVDVETFGEHCASFATDMGEGTVTVDGGKALTHGQGSPVIYSTGNISASNLNGTAENSEMAVIEGKNSVTIEKSNLTGGSGLDGEVSAGVMLYQSMSGDANEGTAFFTAKNSTLTNKASGEKSAFFYVTNTNAVVNLEKTKLLGNTKTLILASGNDSRRGWGRRGANGGTLEFNLISQSASGDVITDEISSVKLNLGKGSVLKGAVNAKKSGKVDVFIEKTAKLELTSDSYFNKFADSDDSFKNIKSNGHIIYYNKNLSENSQLKGRTFLLSDGGKIAPTEYDFSALENAAVSGEKSEMGGMKMPKPNQGENGKNSPKDGQRPPKMELTTLVGTLNVVSDKAMLIDSENKATLVKVMEEKQGGKMGKPPVANGEMKMPPREMNGNPPKNGGMQAGNRPNEMREKPVTFEDLKKLKNKNVEIQGILENDGTFTVFKISEKK